MKSNIIDIEVLIIHLTEKAVLAAADETDEGVWLPLSQVEVDGDPGSMGIISLPKWLAQDKGLI